MEESGAYAETEVSRWSRRRVLGAGAVVGGVWVVPQVLTTRAAAAATVQPLPSVVAVGDSGAVSWRSTDGGVTWQAATTPINGTGLGVATDGAGTWVAVGSSGAFAWRSVDGGVSWQAATTPINGAGRRVATDGAGTWVAVGNGGARSWRSVDGGVSWQAATTPINGTGLGVATDRLLP